MSAVLARKLIETVDEGWSYHGLGFIYLPLGDHRGHNWRLHVWNRELGNPTASRVHTHPWHFTSYVLAGGIVDIVMAESASPPASPVAEPAKEFRWGMVQCGEGGGLYLTSKRTVWLSIVGCPVYAPGDFYKHLSSDLHDTVASDAVTLVARKIEPGDSKAARVFWPADTEFQHCGRRPATIEEVRMARAAALALSWTK